MYETLVTTLRSELGEEAVKLMEPMKKYTTFRIGGPADVLVSVTDSEQMVAAVNASVAAGVTPFVIGNGSNLLVSDEGVRGFVIRYAPDNASEPEVTDFGDYVIVKTSAGAMLSSFAREMTKRGFVGMEFAAGIPGSVGGGVVMNAGAYGGELKDVLVSAEVVNPSGHVITLTAEELELSYRHSCISAKGYTVLSAAFSLKKGDPVASKAIVDDLSAKRKEKQPLEYPSAGSTFKRPEGYFAGKLIQDAGLRGFSVGDAQVSEKHCGFVINKGDATAEEILLLITRVRNKVYEEVGIWLETEVRFVGDFGYLDAEVDRRVLELK